MASTVFAYTKYAQFMDVYETTFLFGAGIVFSLLGWCWKPVRLLLVGMAALSLFSINLYHGDLDSVNKVFFLKFLIGSQTAVMWMNVLFVLAMLTYWFALFARSAFTGKVATSLTWAAVLMGFVGLMVRWYESYLIAPDVGHIPLSNLYEVFILFCLITSLMYLYYEQRYATKQLGGFVMLVVSAAVGFILWYTFSRHANGIQPLVPGLEHFSTGALHRFIQAPHLRKGRHAFYEEPSQCRGCRQLLQSWPSKQATAAVAGLQHCSLMHSLTHPLDFNVLVQRPGAAAVLRIAVVVMCAIALECWHGGTDSGLPRVGGGGGVDEHGEAAAV
jgi:hypothetical protein